MILYEFYLSIATRSQVFDIIREMRDKELAGVIYLWVNQISRKMYVVFLKWNCIISKKTWLNYEFLQSYRELLLP
jgi:hypothetical protein